MMNPHTDQFPKGVLHPQTGKRMFSLTRFQPDFDTGYFVQHYWVVKWDLRGQPPYHQMVLAHPNVNLVFEKGNTRIYGVAHSTSDRLIQDHGWVVGVKFKPGGFYPFWNASVSKLTGRSVSFEQVFELDSKPLEENILLQENAQQAVNRVEAFLRERLPDKDSNVDLTSNIVFGIRDDRTIIKVEDVVRLSQLHKRTLQRLFNRYVGVSPKGVIQRYRLHEAAERMSHGDAPDWLELSLELGYYDQSHFIRDFKSILGTSPEGFTRKNG